MHVDDQRDRIFGSDLGHLMLISYIVLGNNAVTNRYIERNYRMPVQAWSALFAIVTFPGIRAKEIRALFPRPQNTISRAVSLLEARELVEQRSSATDGREKKLFATEAGAALLSEIRAVSLARQEELFSPLTDKERKTFLELARKVADGPQLLETVIMDVRSKRSDSERRGPASRTRMTKGKPGSE